jgi:hypothetical protein
LRADARQRFRRLEKHNHLSEVLGFNTAADELNRRSCLLTLS